MARPPAPDRPSSRRRPARRAAVVAVLLPLVLAGCTGGSASSSGPDAAVATTAAGGATMAAGAAAESGSDGAGEAASSGPGDAAVAAAGMDQVVAAGDARQLIRTADLDVRLPVPARESAEADTAARTAALGTAVADARAAVVAAGGVVASSDGSGDRTTLGLRIPVDAYDGTLDRLAGLGTVEGRTESSRDVTAELVDVASRVQSMKASVDRVRTLLAQATDVGQVVTIEGELARREADLESLQRQQASLSGQVAMSTVTLTLTAVTTGVATVPSDGDGDSGFLVGLSGGWSALLGLLSAISTVAGALLPFAPLFAVGGLLVWWGWRRRRRPIGSPAPVGTDPAPSG